MSELRLAVGAEDAGTRLDRFLAEPLGSRARAQAQIEAGAVTVDGRAVAKRHVLAAGETVLVELPEEPPAPAGPLEGEGTLFTVAFEDEHLMVVDKPAGVVVHPARGHRTGTLSQALAARGAGGGEDPSRAGIVHRLDRDTSGLLVVARSDAVHRALKAQLARRELRREYLALVEGMPQARTGTIEAPIGRDRRDRLMMSIDSDAGRDARTHFEIERMLGEAALLRIVLDTGRTHQIRVHLAAIGLPVAGDPQYGRAGAFGLERQFLHATRLAFTHPVTGGPIDVVSELPPDLRDALERAAG
ncbi:MAG TPA: RluA family pseudouridine synthase [Solirubrobacteraceae bacterium]|nr:RluA family pseudouridine synthase [Solirubrobacteraceae bacterium]